MGTRILTNRRQQEGVVPPPHHADSGLNLPGLVIDNQTKPNMVDLHKQEFIDVSLRPTVFGDPLPEAVEQVFKISNMNPIKKPYSRFSPKIHVQGMDESLSMSLLERFDAMETEAGEPERRIGTVVMERDSKVCII